MIRIELKVLGEKITVEAPMPPEHVRLDEVLPLLHDIDNRAIDLAVKRVEAEGKTISCRKGCSVCCRSQPVPITPPEALALSRLVEALPEPKRAEVKGRFAANVERLRKVGLFDVLMRDVPVNSKEHARETAVRYFQLKLVCPFLDDDACGIYLDRPFVCRQYLVTTPAELCENPFENQVEPIAVPLRPASAMLNVAEAHIGRPQIAVPLALALEYADRHRADLERTFPSAELFRESVAAITAK